jgi:4-diphosphocytidyl-2-C-methyl-D-erythritol kinase
MVIFPKAKINLGLRITNRRSDGYHDIETVFYPAGPCDALEFVEAGEGSHMDTLTVTGIDVGIGSGDNIVLKALNRLRKDNDFPWVKIHLHKAIPHGAGLGGGSSDAACILKAVNRHFVLGLSDNDLKAIALEIGSDCPFFIDCKPAYATGRGEKMDAVSGVLGGYYLVIANPGVGISTKEAYAACSPRVPDESLRQIVTHEIHEWKNLMLNDFEDFAFKKFPLIEKIKNEMYNKGAIFSLMSGSGSSVYGIFTARPVIRSGILRGLITWQGEL